MCSMLRGGWAGGGACGKEEVPGMCIAIVDGVVPTTPQCFCFFFSYFVCETVCFDPMSHKNMVAKLTKARKELASTAHRP